MKKSGIGLAVIPTVLWSALSVAGGSSTEAFIRYTVPKPMNQGPDYWTPERMENAQPYSLKVGKRVGPLRAPSSFDAPSGEPGFDPGRSPDENAAPNSEEGNPTPKTPVDSGSSVEKTLMKQSAAVPMAVKQVGIPVHSTFSVPRVLYAPPTPLYPYSAVGKVFFSTPDGDYVCSGSSIGGRAVLTAGHCVVENGKAHTNWVFVPAYYKGESPYGKWKQTDAFAFQSWIEQGNLGRDVAFSIVADQQGSKLSAAVGALGFVWNYPRERLWAMFGYPAVSPYAGIEMIETLAPTAFIDDVDVSPATTGAGSLQTGGSSGGPWITDFSPGLQVSNFANGVNSYGLPSLISDVMFSPYFDDSVKAMKDDAVAQ